MMLPWIGIEGTWALCYFLFLLSEVNKTFVPQNWIEKPSGNLSSPNFPNQYPRDFIGEWRIEVSATAGIALKVAAFDTEDIEDFLKVSVLLHTYHIVFVKRNISNDSVRRWIPFFPSCATYCLQNPQAKNIVSFWLNI